MSASIQLLIGSCMYNFLRAENSVSSDFLEILTVHKKLTQSKSGAVPYNFKMTLGSSSVKRSVLGKFCCILQRWIIGTENTTTLESYSALSFTKCFQKTTYFVRLRVY